MRVIIDTVLKTIQIEEQVSFKDLTIELEKLLPDNKWKEYSIVPSYQWNNVTAYPIYYGSTGLLDLHT